MRLPIVLNLTNFLLLIMLIIAPWLGKFAREEFLRNKEEYKLKELALLSKAEPLIQSEKQKAPLSRTKEQWLKNRKLEKQKLIEENLKEEVKPSPRPISNQDRLGQIYKPDQEIQLTNSSDFFQKIRDLALNDNYEAAEDLFLNRLKDSHISPLERLEKVDEFKLHYQKLRDHFSSSANKSM